MEVTRQGPLERHRHDHPAHLALQQVQQAGPQRSRPVAGLGPLLGGQAKRGGEPDDAGHVLGAAAPLTLLPAAVQQGAQRRARPHHEAADPLGPAELVGGHADQVSRGRQRPQVAPARGLHGVGVEGGARRPLGHHRGHLGQRRDGADLVVRGHGADDRHLAAQVVEGGGELVGVDGRVGAGPHHPAAGGEDGMEHGVVLGGRAHCGAAPGGHDAQHGQVVGLGPAGGEDHLPRAAAQDVGHLVSSLVQGQPGLPGHPVATRGVAEPLGEERQHGLERLGPQRGGGGVVEVDDAPGDVGARGHAGTLIRDGEAAACRRGR